MGGRGISILSTRQLDEEIVKKAASHGISIDCRAFIHTYAVESKNLQEQVNSLAAQHANIVFTSYNAVKAVADMLRGKVNWNVYCISGRTENAVREQLKGARVKASTANAKELASVIAEHNINEAVFFSGNLRLNDLPDTLSADGISLKELVVYHTELKPAKIEQKYDGIAFFSPSAVESFFMRNELTEDVPCFTIGSTTAAALENLNNPVITSPSADVATMIDKVIEYYKND